MPYSVYRITNLKNGKFYIGKTSDVQGRWLKHQSVARLKTPGDYSYLHRAINKYGIENFTIEIIQDYASELEALAGETHYISVLGAQNRSVGYNLTAGGDGLSGYQQSSKAKEKNRQSHLGKTASSETKQRMSEAHLGHEVSDETKEKMREARAKQEPMSDETRQKMSEAKRGKTLSEDHKANISRNNSSRKLTEEDVLQIISVLNAGIMSQAEIAIVFGVDTSTISNIKRGRKWKRFYHLISNAIVV